VYNHHYNLQLVEGGKYLVEVKLKSVAFQNRFRCCWTHKRR